MITAMAWPASAQSVGLSFGVAVGDRTTASLGLDLRYAARLHRCSELVGLGPFGQAALLFNGGGVAGRFSLGAHMGWAFGAAEVESELGWTYRTAYHATPTQPVSPAWHGLHAGLLAWFTVAEELSVRGAIPLRGPLGARPEMTVALGARFPPPLFGNQEYCGTGRPLQIDGRPWLPEVIRGTPRRPGAGPRDAPTRRALAEAWLADARAECASIPVFLGLARDLAAVGAPAVLIAGALDAAEDELSHTVMCASVAARLSGTPAVPELLDVPAATDRSRDEALARLAVESWRDGCVGEGRGAAQARAALAGAEDPLARAALARIAVDEQRHADLAWEILRFCLASGGPSVVEALAIEAARQPPARMVGSRPGERLDAGAWRAHGRLGDAFMANVQPAADAWVASPLAGQAVPIEAMFAALPPDAAHV
jgi:hypothetical protein